MYLPKATRKPTPGASSEGKLEDQPQIAQNSGHKLRETVSE